MLTNRTPNSEYHERWKRAQAACKEQQVDAILVWSRGGGTLDTSDDVIYMANHCGVFPFCPDLKSEWSALSNAAFILPISGEPTLVIDSPVWRKENVPVEDVRWSPLLPDKVAETLLEMGLAGKRVGLVAGNALMLAPYRRLVAGCPSVQFVPMDDAIEKLRVKKSALEFEYLREAAVVGNAAMLAMMQSALRPGSTEAEAVSAAYKIAIERGSALIDAAVASGPNSHFYAYGQVPQWTTRQLKEGDFFHCDMYGAAVEGYRYDLSRTVVCGGKPTADQEFILDGAIASIEAGIAEVKPGAKACDIWNAVHSVLVSKEIECGYPLHGHSYGLGWESPWMIQNEDAIVEAGMAIAIETMAGKEGIGYVKFEHNILVHEDRVELLTTCPAKPWL